MLIMTTCLLGFGLVRCNRKLKYNSEIKWSWWLHLSYQKKLGAREMAQSVKCLLGKHEKCSNPIIQVKASLAACSLVLGQSRQNPGFHWPARPASWRGPHSVEDPVSKNKVERDWAEPLALLLSCTCTHVYPKEVVLGTLELVSPLCEQKDWSLGLCLFQFP